MAHEAYQHREQQCGTPAWIILSATLQREMTRTALPLRHYVVIIPILCTPYLEIHCSCSPKQVSLTKSQWFCAMNELVTPRAPPPLVSDLLPDYERFEN